MPAIPRQRCAQKHSGAGVHGDRDSRKCGQDDSDFRGGPEMKANQVGRFTGTTLQPVALLLSITLALAWPAWAAPDASDTTWDGSEPPQGIYFYWYEPSFYTGFAPRTQDPQRLHIRLSRGNQVRVTLVLGEKELDAYLDDLVQRRKTYQELIDA